MDRSDTAALQERVISLGSGLAAIPERLLLAHARGEVLFICGAGISRPANLPDFRELVIDVYQALDPGVHTVLSRLPRGVCNQWEVDCNSLTDRQTAEVKRFTVGDYDVVLGMLERRLDEKTSGNSQVRREVANRLRRHGNVPADVHRTLMRLADRGGTTTIVTTNFDLLLEAGRKRGSQVETYALGSIPRPTRQTEFAGVLHVHGALDRDPNRFSELVLSDQDFGEFYLRRRVVPDFIYDAARLFHLVLVGYSANDPPMRYLLNAVAADGSRFDDLKERFTFFGTHSPDSVALEDWKARGITPIHYDAADNHKALQAILDRWAEFSAINGKPTKIDAQIRRLVKDARSAAPEADRDLFDHLIRRSNTSERVRLSSVASKAKADLGWLDAIIRIGLEHERTRRT
ncbi:SIR2 family protein [Bradyrhizobium sp. CCGB12]|uniref:SIR2 family protein n=1 Tax=Bradyrhizobium sp. CCGB12 TaxID=2949632 RepID=UPI0020B42E4B|nr:SIR2 family protein [Bradyrhizobium sp. CCGB12]MCP3392335.1 SIR2 family protein [Bradyrhizobium sp. CCGB12]